ncbi:MAG TPA: hypothetical protein VN692_16530, partial [Steroidobacteraceae bacterium]|nr:hypothetical protein [Steroidobacteraceae bacterium]
MSHHSLQAASTLPASKHPHRIGRKPAHRTRRRLASPPGLRLSRPLSTLQRAMNIPRPNPAGRFDPASLFSPTSVAVIGGAAGFGARIHANLTIGGFTGQIQAVDAVAHLDQPPQLAVLALPPEAIGSAMHELAAKGCFCAIVPGAADNLRALAARTGVRVLGPHAFGVAVPPLGLNASLAHIVPPQGHLA